MGERRRVFLGIFFATLLHISYGCQMEGVNIWAIPISVTMLDTFRGTILSRSTTDIEAITSINYGEATLGGPYFTLSLVDSQFLIQTNDAFEQYEEHEVASLVSVNVEFRCSGATTTGFLTVLISITDTNNNAPRFIPTDDFEFVVAPPLPPGYLITGCFNDITVRDIDLTTQRIEFSIEDNPYFEIAYDPSASTEAKEFKAVLRTTTFIRSLAEPLTFTITATDVDLTNDPPLSTSATLRIVGDAEFQFPEEPIFGQAFYLANYTEDHQLNLLETISLQQGFDEYVDFTLEGEYAASFNLIPNVNEVSLVVTTQLSVDVWSQGQIYLIVRAVREFTSGDTTTVVVQFPEVVPLQFERAIYEGTITNNAIQISQLVLSQGYETDIVSAEIIGEHSNYFTTTVNGNLITISMSPLNQDIIENNNLLSMQVVASTARSETSTVVNLEIIKDDNVTPVFDKLVYTATYDPDTGLDAEQITFLQGYDGTVSVELDGEHAYLFQYNQEGLVITLTSLTIPPELYSLQNIVISILANKPRTVGANAAITIALPAAREIEFEEYIYRGTIEDNELSLETIQLSYSYEGVEFNLTGEHSTYFTATGTQGQIVVSLSSLLPDTVIIQNNVIMLTLTAYGTNVITTRTSILLDIIKEDTTTPVFTRNIYYGTFSGTAVEIEAINLGQEYDTGVTFRLDGADAQYFTINGNGNNAVITLQLPIPDDVIFNRKVLLFNVLADKAFTVGANAAVLITFPAELTEATVMRFSQNAYIGYLEENELGLENIVLETGFATGTEFYLSGDYYEHFSLTSSDNVVQISSLGSLPTEVLESNDFILLEIEARRERAVSVWTSVAVDIVKQEIVAPVFNQAYYTGVYTEEMGLIFEEAIFLEEGDNEPVTFALVGELSMYFDLVQEVNAHFLVLVSQIPSEVLATNNHILITVVAENSYNLTGRAVISIDLPKDFLNSSFRFSQTHYKGYLDDENLTLDAIILVGYTNDVIYSFTGDYVEYFQITLNEDGIFNIQIPGLIPPDILEQTNVFVLNLNAQNSFIRTHTVIVVEVRTAEEFIEFEQPYYIGTYSESTQLEFNSEIRVTNTVAVTYGLEGDDAQWFELEQSGNSATLILTSTIPGGVLENNRQLVFVVTAQNSGSTNVAARATVIISLTDGSQAGSDETFEKVLYEGTIQNGVVNHETIIVTSFSGSVVELQGEYSSMFVPELSNNAVTVRALDSLALPADVTHVALQLHAGSATSVLLLDVIRDGLEAGSDETFEKVLYEGTIQNGVVSHEIIIVTGFTGSFVELQGEYSSMFVPELSNNAVTVRALDSLALPADVTHVALQLHAGSATSVLLLDVIRDGSEPGSDETFEKVLFEGTIQNSVVSHEIIIVTGFSGSIIELQGEYSSMFVPELSDNAVTVRALDSLALPAAVTHVALQLHAGSATSVLLLDVIRDGLETGSDAIFEKALYEGTIQNGIVSHETIIVTGFSGSIVELQGEYSSMFVPELSNNAVTVRALDSLALPVDVTHVVLQLQAGNAVSVLLLDVIRDGSEPGSDETFEKILYEGTIQNGVVSHEIIIVTGFSGSIVELHGEYSSMFVPELSDNAVTVRALDSLALPADVTHVALQLHAGSATSVLLLDVIRDGSEPGSDETFEKILYEGTIQNGVVSHEIIIVTGFSGSIVELHGEYSSMFVPELSDNAVTVRALDSLALPADVTHVALQLHAGSATSVLLLDVIRDGSEAGSDETFEKVLYEGSIQNGVVSHETIIVTGFTGSFIELQGEYSSMFVPELSNYAVTVRALDSLALPADVTHVALQLRAGSAISVLLLDVIRDGSEPGSDETFEKVLYEGTIQNGVVSHETIIVTGFSGSIIELQGEYSSMFVPELSDNAVTVRALDSFALPAAVTHVALQLHAGIATSVLLLDVIREGSEAGSNETFEKVLYEGTIQNGVISHETIIVTGYAGSIVELQGEYSTMFVPELSNNEVTVRALDSLALPADVTHVALQLHAGSATSVLLLDVIRDGLEAGSNETFEKVLYEGTIQNGVVSHETIIVTGFVGSIVELQGEYSYMFATELTNNAVTVRALDSLALPADVTHVALQLHAGSATSVLLLDINRDGSEPGSNETFEKVLYEGTIQNGVVSHETIIVTGFSGSIVELQGEYSSMFVPELTNNVVTVRALDSLALPVDVTYVLLQLHAGNAVSVLLLDVIRDGSEAGSDESFEKVLYEGTIQNGVVSHENIIVTGFSGSIIELQGEYSSMFATELTNNAVTVRALDALALPADVTHVALQLHAGSATSVLLLDINRDGSEPGSDETFEKVLYEGTIQNGVVSHETIIVTGFSGSIVELQGEYSSMFVPELTNNVVTVRALDSLALPVDVTHVLLQLHAGNAVSVLLLDVIRDGSEAGSDESFEKVLYEGTIQNGVVSHENIIVTGFSGSIIELQGEYSSMFATELTNNAVTVRALDSLALPADVTHVALQLHAGSATSVLLLDINSEGSEPGSDETFEKVLYEGTIQNGVVSHETIIVTGFSGSIVELQGEYSSMFVPELTNNVVTVRALDSLALPVDVTHVLLQLHAGNAVSVLLLDVIRDGSEAGSDESFEKVLYEGTIQNGVVSHENIIVTGFSGSIIELQGEYSSMFVPELSNNVVTVRALDSLALPADVTHVALQLHAGNAVSVLLLDVILDGSQAGSDETFEKVLYEGTIQNGVVSHETIIVTGFSGLVVELQGEYSSMFVSELSNNAVTVRALDFLALPADVTHVVLQLHAGSAASVLLLDVIRDGSEAGSDESFAKVLYEGNIQNGVVSHETIIVTGFAGLIVELQGEYSSMFVSELSNNEVTVRALDSLALPVDVTHVVLQLHAGNAVSVLLLDVIRDGSQAGSDETFEKVLYEGTIQNGVVSHETIIVTGFSGLVVELQGEYSSMFVSELSNNAVTVRALDFLALPADVTHVVLQLHAGSAASVLLLDVIRDGSEAGSDESFAKVLYEGNIQNGVVSHETIIVTGFAGLIVELQGEYSSMFVSELSNNAVTVRALDSLALPVDVTHVVLQLHAGNAVSVLLLDVIRDGSQAGSDETFEKVLYEGTIQNGVVSHETIIVTGFSGLVVELQGEYSSMFATELSNNAVTVRALDSLALPADVTHVALQLHAGSAASVLLLDVNHDDVPSVPTVTFSSPSYAVRVDITQTGLVGQVHASSDNGENVQYSLQLDNAHLAERLSVNNEGELHLSASVNTGIYTFVVVATTVFTQTSGTATIHLSVEAITVCRDEYVVAPLIVLDIDEEEPHYDLINGTHENCHFTLTNRWPLEQSWVYIDERGLHTTAIDREHESIAFMPVSQIQVEIILHCDGDTTRSKRSLTSDALGPYDYGNNKWILTDTILYNSRRSLVNIIVNDINDNTPIFVNKAVEPIAVGYPVPDLAERVLPRSLAELQATDADIGENAALIYWSSAPELAVAPSTGFVHLRDGVTLTEGAQLTVSATDRNGEGLTGSIDILVRLLDESKIAVVTVRDAFLDDEQTIISYLSEGVGYEVKVLRSVVVSDGEANEQTSRRKSDITSDSGASLQLYVYGLIAREPVDVDRLTTDVSNIAIATVIVASSVSLQDHLKALEICVIAGRDTGLLVATIVLSVLLFIVLVLIAVWFFLRWRRKKNYDQFSDESSLASRDESVEKFPKQEVVPKPRLDIAELKKSERRLQEMLDAPIQVVTEPTTSRNDAVLELSKPETSPAPIVIQSIDKLKDAADESSDDEFGEIKSKRRKSVVTFNENVEKIIHLEDNDDPEDISTDAEYEIYKL